MELPDDQTVNQNLSQVSIDKMKSVIDAMQYSKLNENPKMDAHILNSIELMKQGEYELTNAEKAYLIAVDRGDVATVRKLLEEAFTYYNINMNCIDPYGRSALLIAIENENTEMLHLLLEYGVETGDAVLHAINEEYVEAVEMLLNRKESSKKRTIPPDMVAPLPKQTSSFTLDITPIILASHRDNYEIIKLLLDRGETIPKPHDVQCGCKDCVQNQKDDSLRHSRSRINAYKALASPSLICLSSKDPILTAFELSWELRRLSRIENEFKSDYEKLSDKCKNFACDLLDQTRSSSELEIMLNHDVGAPTNEEQISSNKMTLSRLKLAIKYKQKKFVAHPHVQQLLASLWYEGLPGFRRKNIVYRIILILIISCCFPFLSLIYIIAPFSWCGQLIRKPYIKFISHASSYVCFLLLLMVVSLAPNDKEYRGSLPSGIECIIIFYVFGLVWVEIKQIWSEGPKEYIHDMWNLLDFITNTLYISTIVLRVVAHFRVRREKSEGNPHADLARKDWDAYDPNLIAECMFAAANIFSQLKLVYIFTVNPHLGPLQISLGRMVVDIMKWFIVYTMVLIAFACGINQLYSYYSYLRKSTCDVQGGQIARLVSKSKYCYRDPMEDPCSRKYQYFSSLFEIGQSLYWALYGLIDLDSLELKEKHDFTEFIGKLFFGCYKYVCVIVLVNMLIAMMSNSYQFISSESDTEWKFARSKLWISYFDEGDTSPPPFNIIITPKTLYYGLVWIKQHFFCTCDADARRSKWATVKRLVKAVNDREIRYQAVMKDLTKRYIMCRQKEELHNDVTEDDINEIKQDISSFRYELMDVLRQNGMKTPARINTLHGKGKKGRRRSFRELRQQSTIYKNMTNQSKDENDRNKHILADKKNSLSLNLQNKTTKRISHKGLKDGTPHFKWMRRWGSRIKRSVDLSDNNSNHGPASEYNIVTTKIENQNTSDSSGKYKISSRRNNSTKSSEEILKQWRTRRQQPNQTSLAAEKNKVPSLFDSSNLTIPNTYSPNRQVIHQYSDFSDIIEEDEKTDSCCSSSKQTPKSSPAKVIQKQQCIRQQDDPPDYSPNRKEQIKHLNIDMDKFHNHRAPSFKARKISSPVRYKEEPFSYTITEPSNLKCIDIFKRSMKYADSESESDNRSTSVYDSERTKLQNKPQRSDQPNLDPEVDFSNESIKGSPYRRPPQHL